MPRTICPDPSRVGCFPDPPTGLGRNLGSPASPEWPVQAEPKQNPPPELSPRRTHRASLPHTGMVPGAQRVGRRQTGCCQQRFSDIQPLCLQPGRGRQRQGSLRWQQTAGQSPQHSKGGCRYSQPQQLSLGPPAQGAGRGEAATRAHSGQEPVPSRQGPAFCSRNMGALTEVTPQVPPLTNANRFARLLRNGVAPFLLHTGRFLACRI